MRIDLPDDKEPTVDMAPLIDCVFLLLIFFLVTTMMKKWESQIPVKLPEMTSSLSRLRSAEETPVIALAADGSPHEVLSHDAYSGETVWQPLDDLSSHLSLLRARHGAGTPLEIAAARGVSAQRVIEVFDYCQLAGFTRTRVRLGSEPHENPGTD